MWLGPTPGNSQLCDFQRIQLICVACLCLLALEMFLTLFHYASLSLGAQALCNPKDYQSE